MEIKFEGKKALVTGGSQGLGRAIAIKLAKGGAKVFVIGRNKSLLENLSNYHKNITTISQDIKDWDMTKAIVQNIGHIDLLVNSAGVGSQQAVGEITPEAFDVCFSTNVKALVNVSQTVAEMMKAKMIPGSIVNISSQASQAALYEHTVYCATKAAVDAVTRVMALELGPYKIRVNSVNPTVVLTEMGKLAWSDPKKSGPMKAKIPLGKFAEEEDVANAVLFLLSDKAGMTTGSTLPVEGGFLAC